jgi:hypothetical protein
MQTDDEPGELDSAAIYAGAGPALRVAFVVSLMVHTLFVFVMYRAYSELAGSKRPMLQIIAQARVPRPAAPPVLVTRPAPEARITEEIVRPVAREVSLDREPAPTLTTAVVAPQFSSRTPGRRLVAAATLPVTPVELPPTEDAASFIEAELASVAMPVWSLPKYAAPLAPGIRIASRPQQTRVPSRHITPAIISPRFQTSSARQPTPAFAHRGLPARLPRESRHAIDLGLEFLARVQQDDGRWRFSDLRGVTPMADAPATLRADAAATGLALMAFLAAGYDHFDDRYQLVVHDGLAFLQRIQQRDGGFFPDDATPEGQITRFYSHGIATLALCESLGMTGDTKLRDPAQRALNLLTGSNDPARNMWRYQPGVNSDATATGWQLAALQTGQLAGLRVEQETFACVRECLAMCRVNESQTGSDESIVQPVTTLNTAVGLAVDLHLGDSLQQERLRGAADHLLAHSPEVRMNEVDAQLAPDAAANTANPRRDTYYWYYGSEAMHRLGGNDWQSWSTGFYPHLVETQVRTGPLAGSWDPRSATSSYGTDCAGRLYVTAMNLLSLEIQQRQQPLTAAAAPDNTSR